MKNRLFKVFKDIFYKKEPESLSFKKGQKVKCSSCDICLAVLYTAIVVKWTGFKPAWIRPNGCDWYLVRFENGNMLNLPECVIAPHDVQIKRLSETFEREKERLGIENMDIISVSQIINAIES